MKILISPAKIQNQKPHNHKQTTPIFLQQAQSIREAIQSLSEAQLQTFIKASSKLTNLTYQLYHQQQQSHAAIFTYDGEVFKNINPSNFNNKQMNMAQSTLRIASAMYGILKPLDAITPYRLDYLMNLTDIGLDNGYSYWKDNITHALLKECQQDEIIINLASSEFALSFDIDKIKDKCHWIDVEFKEMVNQNLKIVTMHAKKARGLAVNALINHPINQLNDLNKVKQIGDFQLDLINSTSNKRIYIKK